MTAVAGRAQRAAGRIWARVRQELPSGKSLPGNAWAPRHQAMLFLLWLHVVVLTVYGSARGAGPVPIALGGGTMFALAALATWERPPRRARAAFASLGLVTASAFVVHLARGQIEAHFHLFVVLSIIALYEDYVPFLLCLGYVVLHHGILGSIAPQSVYAHADGMLHPWKWAWIHAGFIVAFSIAIGLTWRIAERARASAKDLLASTTEGIVALDGRRRVSFANRAALRVSGFQEADLVGQPVETLLRARPEKPGRSTEGVLRRADGKEVSVEWSEAPLEGAPGGRSRVITFRETAHRREAERQLEAARLQLARSEKLTAVGQLVAGVAHEIRTPLTYLENSLHLIDRRLQRVTPALPEASRTEAADIPEHMRNALEAAERINQLVEDLRRYSKLKTGAPDAVAIHDVVQEAVHLFAATHRAHVRVRTALLPTVPTRVDRVQVQQIVLNLLQNAAEAMPRGGTITVQSMMHAGNVVVVVEDEGRGIPAEIRDRIYDPFFTTKADGTGLGLSIVKRLVEEHRGTIHCEERYGGGTRFEVSFPIIAHGTSGTRREIPVQGAPPTKPQTA